MYVVFLGFVISHFNRLCSIHQNILNGQRGYHITANLTPCVLYDMTLFDPGNLEAGYLKNILLVRVRS